MSDYTDSDVNGVSCSSQHMWPFQVTVFSADLEPITIIIISSSVNVVEVFSFSFFFTFAHFS